MAREFSPQAESGKPSGAQPLLPDRLAAQILNGEFGEGDTVEVDVADGGSVFSKVAATEPVGTQVS